MLPVFLPGFVPGTRPRKENGESKLRGTAQIPILGLEALVSRLHQEKVANKGDYDIVQVGGTSCLPELIARYKFLEQHQEKVFLSRFLLSDNSVWQGSEPLFWVFLPGRINTNYPSGNLIIARSVLVIGPGSSGGLFEEYYHRFYPVNS